MACLRPQDTWGWFDKALEHMGEHVFSSAKAKGFSLQQRTLRQ
jgi:hypothetical protein